MNAAAINPGDLMCQVIHETPAKDGSGIWRTVRYGVILEKVARWNHVTNKLLDYGYRVAFTPTDDHPVSDKIYCEVILWNEETCEIIARQP